MSQESSLQSWLETVETKKKIIREKENRCDQLEGENGALGSKNAESVKRIKILELDCAEANKKVMAIDGTLAAVKRLSESLTA